MKKLNKLELFKVKLLHSNMILQKHIDVKHLKRKMKKLTQKRKTFWEQILLNRW